MSAMPAAKTGKELGKRCYEFDDFLIDGSNFRLCKSNDVVTVPPRAFDVLLYLIENRERVVEKQELFDRVWEAEVSKDALRGAIKEIRQVLGDDAAKPRYIQTVARRGYRFIAKIDSSPLKVPIQDSPAERLSAEPGSTGITEKITKIPVNILTIGIASLGPILLTGIVFAVLKGSPPILAVEADDFDRLLNVYNLRHAVLTQNCYLQSVFIGIGIALILLSNEGKIRIPALGSTLSVSWLHFVLAPVLLYLWIEFGFALDDLIKYRAEAWQYLASIGNPHDQPLNRRAMLFNDSGFVDGWFMCFRPQQHAISTNFLPGSAFFFALVFGTLFSLNHAYILTGLRAGAAQFFPKTRHSSSLSLFVRLVPWISLLLIALSHLQFRFGGKHPNWIQPVIGLSTIFFAYLLSRRRAATSGQVP